MDGGFLDRGERFEERAEDRMSADAAKPIGSVAGIRLATVGDRVPIGRIAAIAEIVGALRGLMAFFPKIEDLRESGRETKQRNLGRGGEDRRERGGTQARAKLGTGRRSLHERRPERFERRPECEKGQSRDHVERLNAGGFNHAGERFAVRESIDDDLGV